MLYNDILLDLVQVVLETALYEEGPDYFLTKGGIFWSEMSGLSPEEMYRLALQKYKLVEFYYVSKKNRVPSVKVRLNGCKKIQPILYKRWIRNEQVFNSMLSFDELSKGLKEKKYTLDSRIVMGIRE